MQAMGRVSFFAVCFLQPQCVGASTNIATHRSCTPALAISRLMGRRSPAALARVPSRWLRPCGLRSLGRS